MRTETMQIMLLGPVGLTVDGAARGLSGLRRKSVLAVLGLHRGEAVSSDRIVDIVWGERPPATVTNALHNVVSHLRGVLGERSSIEARGAGYALALPDEAVDLGRAESLIAASSVDTDPARRADRLRAALDLWRGVSLSDVAEVPWLAEQSSRLERLRVEATIALFDARMALGEHSLVVPALERLAEAHPFQEDLHRQLILALYRCGRQADALDAYRRLRLTLIAELGVEPGRVLRELEVAILRQDPGLDVPVPGHASKPAPERAAFPAPAQLPRAPGTFTGRLSHLAELDAVLSAEEWSTPVVVVCGTTGVGKTSLALWWANGVTAAFPDGQLHVNLRGFDPDEQAADPSQVLHGFLRALGVPAGEVPPALDERAALYRTVLTGRRVLVVLDNARDEDQVRPLLPGPSTGMVVVTSRSRLAGLVVADGARTVRLDLPTHDEARQILAQRLGAQRVAAEPDAVDEIIARCARLPLALAVAAAHPAADPTLTLARLAEELRDGAAPLEAFRGGDTATDVRAVFSWSYRALSAPAARLFRRLGMCGAAPAMPDFTLAAAASLAGLPPRQTRHLLAELVRMHLVTEPSTDRYACHDLLRAFGTEQASTMDSVADRSASLYRLLEHFLHTAFTAAQLLRPGRSPIVLAPARAGVYVTELADADAAIAWFEHDLAALLSSVRRIPSSPSWRPWQLAWTLVTFLDRQNRWDDYAAVHETALDAAQRDADALGQAYAHWYLARVGRKRNRLAETHEHHERAIHLFGVVGDPAGQARVLSDAAHAADVEGRTRDAIRHCEAALVLHRSAGATSGEAHALSNLGWLHLELGDLEAALDLTRQGLSLHRVTGDREGQAGAWDTLGRLHFRLGDHRHGIDSYHRAIVMYHQTGDWYDEADTTAALGDDLAEAGDPEMAHTVWQRAVVLLDRFDHTGADSLRAKILTVAR